MLVMHAPRSGLAARAAKRRTEHATQQRAHVSPAATAEDGMKSSFPARREPEFRKHDDRSSKRSPSSSPRSTEFYRFLSQPFFREFARLSTGFVMLVIVQSMRSRHCREP